MIDLTKAPYYDDFDPSKKFKKILAVPGKAEQNREFNQIQSILLYALQNLSSALLREGSIVGGMDFIISDNVVTISPGKIYLNNTIHDFDEQSISITGVGVENIGVQLVQTIITEADDPTLRDPTVGYMNYSQPGAHRLKETVSLILNNNTVPTIYTFVDGMLQLSPQKPQLDIVNDLLARRLFDQSGNYGISGLTMSVKPNVNDVNSLILDVDAGRAYVNGYEVNRYSPIHVIIPKAQDTKSVTGESLVYHVGTNKYLLSTQYVKELTSVIATVQVTQTITRGTTVNGLDPLPLTPVVSIVSVTQGATTYVPNTDYKLSANNVDWSLLGAEPSPGTTYSVTWTYNKSLVAGTDCTLTYDSMDDPSTSYINFGSGSIPVGETNVLMNYDYYLARKDRVYLDYKGNAVISSGHSDITAFAVAPPDNMPNMLSLGTLELLPNSTIVSINNDIISRISMKDMTSLIQRVNNLEYNVALNDLDNQAMLGQSPTALKGIFTEGFMGFSKCDLGSSDFTAALDLNNNLLSQSYNTSVLPLVIDAPNTVAKIFDNSVAMCNYLERTILSQSLGTRTINVNQYNVFNDIGQLEVIPNLDNWIDTSSVEINNTITNASVIKWWNASTTTKTTTTEVVDSIIPYARQIDLTIVASGLPPYSDSLKCTIDGKLASLTPSAPSVAGLEPGTIKADANGNAKGTFTIPSEVRTGTQEVLLFNDLVNAPAVFTSNGINETTTTTNTTTITYFVQRRSRDPLAQSFQLTEGNTLIGVNLYFSDKDENIPVQVQLRDMVNGYPGTTVYAECNLNPSDVNCSTNGSIPTKAMFKTPAFCSPDTQYCIVVITSSNKYNVYVATLAGQDLTTGSYVSGQPYVDGVLFLSSNAITWSADQTSDLKFDLIGGEFISDSVLAFNEITPVDIDGVLLLNDYILPIGTSCKWEYTTDGSMWFTIDSYVSRDLPAVATKVDLRATLYTSNPKISPMISMNNLNLIGLKLNQSCSYVSKTITTSQPFTTIKQIIEVYAPSGSTVLPKLSIDGTTYVDPTLASSSPVDSGYTQITYNYTIPSSGSSTTFKARINLDSGNRTAKPTVRKFLNILT
ncbi:MAG: DUF4815 domain-containing protein [Bacteroidota bacterium]|nr:DUF4815 domain-containing protein [Bacteroidota bacterium]